RRGGVLVRGGGRVARLVRGRGRRRVAGRRGGGVRGRRGRRCVALAAGEGPRAVGRGPGQPLAVVAGVVGGRRLRRGGAGPPPGVVAGRLLAALSAGLPARLGGAGRRTGEGLRGGGAAVVGHLVHTVR